MAVSSGARGPDLRPCRLYGARCGWALLLIVLMPALVTTQGCNAPPRHTPAGGLVSASGSSSAQTSAANVIPRTTPERRLLAQQLAQQGDPASGATLEQLLRDDDMQTLRWAVFGLGQLCAGREVRTVRALVARATSLIVQGVPLSVEASRAFPLALSRCSNNEAERTLLAWLGRAEPDATQAALGLARFADRQHALQDSSLVGLIDAAANPEASVPTALLAIDRVAGLAPSAATRVTDVAGAALKLPGSERAFAISALTHGDNRADSLLGQIINTSTYSVSERTAAIRALTRRGAAGQAMLAHALIALSSEFADADLTHAPWPVLLAALRSQPSDFPHSLQRTLHTWASWPAPKAAPSFIVLRITQVRCLSAALLARDDSLEPRLVGCDEPNGLTGNLAQLEVMDRTEIKGKRLEQWQHLLSSARPRVRQAALRLLDGHRELPITALPAGLNDPQPGTVAAAALLLAKNPDRAMHAEANDTGNQVDDAIVKALTTAFDRQYGPDQSAVRGALADAAGALQLLMLKSKIEQLCKDASEPLRQKAKRALVMLGDRNADCPAPPRAGAPAATVAAATVPLDKPIVLTFETSAGNHTLTLRSDLAPRSVQRVLELVGEGFYDNMNIHRAAPGQVVQIGDPVGDGYGGCGRPPIVSEPSPEHFAAFTVGMADWGPDTASSQLFVTLQASPSLDGQYTWIGTASSSWENLVLDDVIEHVKVQ